MRYVYAMAARADAEVALLQESYRTLQDVHLPQAARISSFHKARLIAKFGDMTSRLCCRTSPHVCGCHAWQDGAVPQGKLGPPTLLC